MKLIHAVKTRNIDAVHKELARNPLLINEQDEYGWSALHYAFALNCPDIAKTLLDSGADQSLESFEEDRPVDLGLLFYSMGCLRLIDNQLLFNKKYQTLLKYESDGMQIKEKLHGREKYFAYAELAKKYVRKERKIKATNYPGRVDGELRRQQIKSGRQYKNIQEIFKNSLFNMDSTEFFSAYLSEKTQIGNCDSQSAMAYLLCKRVFGLRKVEKFEIKKYQDDNYEETAALSGYLYDIGDHIALVLGRGEPNELNHHRDWGPQAVVCDPWADAVYFATDIESRLNNLVSIRERDGNWKKEFRRFDSDTHYLQFTVPQDRLRLPTLDKVRDYRAQVMLTHYYSKHKEMTKEQKIHTLKDIAQKFPSEGLSIKRVAEHKEANLKRFTKLK